MQIPAVGAGAGAGAAHGSAATGLLLPPHGSACAGAAGGGACAVLESQGSPLALGEVMAPAPADRSNKVSAYDAVPPPV